VRVKRYIAETLQDAMIKVKMDMGKDAVILHTRKFKEGGFFGFFGKVMFEVTAAMEDAPPAAPAPIVRWGVCESAPVSLQQCQTTKKRKINLAFMKRFRK